MQGLPILCHQPTREKLVQIFDKAYQVGGFLLKRMEAGRMRLIDADALLKNYIGGNILIARTDYAQGARDIIEDIIDAPTVEPEQKKGKWLSHYEYCKRKGYIPSGLNALWWCDLCEQGVEHPTNFCPNCGAKLMVDLIDDSVEDSSHPFADDVMMEDGKDEYEKAIDTLKANYNNFSEELKGTVDKAIEATEHLI